MSGAAAAKGVPLGALVASVGASPLTHTPPLPIALEGPSSRNDPPPPRAELVVDPLLEERFRGLVAAELPRPVKVAG